MSNFESTLARIQELSKYGQTNEGEQKCDRSIEYHLLGADGKEYGILREGNKFYIKSAPKGKGTLSEAYEYIGGILNKKNYQYSSYNDALKNFEMKMMSINEAYNGNVNTEVLDPYKKNIVLAEATDSMKDAIARMRQIMHNTAIIMNESSPFGCAPVKEQPEAAKGNSGDTDAPFTDEVKFKENDEAPKATEPEKQSTPFDEKVKVNESSVESEGNCASTEKVDESASDVDDASKDLEGIDDDDDMTITDEPSDDSALDADNGFTDDEPEDLSSEDEPSDDDSDATDDDDITDDDFEPSDDDDDVTDDSEPSDDEDDLAAKVADLEAQLEELKAQLEGKDNNEPEDDDTDGFEFDVNDDEPSDDESETFDESKLNQLVDKVFESVKKNTLKEDELHVFGQHPGYRKKTMTLPPTGSDSNEHGKDWSDESVHSEKPFGEKIGKGTPFDELVNKVASELFERIQEGKKKVK